MLIRMVHVRPSLGPIPQPRQPRTLIRALKMAPMLWEPSAVPSDGPATTPSAPPWRLRRLDHVCEARRDRDLPGHFSHDRRAGRTATPGARPFISRPPTALEATPETRCRDGNHRAHVAKPHVVTLLAALHRDLPGHSRTHAWRFGTATIHAGFGWCALSACFETRASACCALTAYAPFRALSSVTGRFVCFETPPAGAATLVVGSGSCPARPCATLRPVRQRAAPLAKRLTQSKACPPRAMGQTPCVFIALAG
jgi:hypothetical protein